MAKKNFSIMSTPSSAVDFQEIKAQINALRTNMVFLKSLTDADVASMNKISDGDKTYITDCLIEAANAQDLLPAYFNTEDIRQANTLNDSLYELEDMLFETYQAVKRNRMAAADRAYGGVSTFYGLIKAAADAHVPKAIAMYRRLQDYHKKKLEAGKIRKRKEEAAKQSIFNERVLQPVLTN
jgi:hypothetical protein